MMGWRDGASYYVRITPAPIGTRTLFRLAKHIACVSSPRKDLHRAATMTTAAAWISDPLHRFLINK
jgi:hypothetical protein